MLYSITSDFMWLNWLEHWYSLHHLVCKMHLYFQVKKVTT